MPVSRTSPNYFRLVENRIVRPRWWRHVVLPRLRRMSDEDFKRLFPFRNETTAFVEDFHRAARLRFFFHPRNQKDFFLHLLAQTQSHEQIIFEAEETLANRFEALGSGRIELGPRIDWQRDFKSGRRWPLEPSWAIDILDLETSSDIKVPWELSRFHQTWWLGKAYWLTLNERYAAHFAALVDDWITQNPVGKGVNWCVAMEASIRACNWMAGYFLFCESPSLSSDFWLRFLKSLYEHGLFVRNNLEYARRSGNHYVADLVGMMFLGILFGDAPFGKEWLYVGVKGLHEEMERQVYADGVSYEKSISYQRLVMEFFTVAAILGERNGIRLERPFRERLERMYEFLLHTLRPDGSVPLVGDADDGHLFRLRMEEEMNDYRSLLSVGAILFERSDFKRAAGNFSQEALWFFGGEGFERHQLLREEAGGVESKGFPEGGFFVMRSEETHLFVDVGDIGMEGRGGHGHNDTLSFELWVDGAPLVVDSGTFTYTAEPALRNAFRSTRAHNTVVIDGKEQAEFSGLWSVRKDQTNPKVIEWTTTEEKDVLEALHEAYAPVVHRRRFELEKGSRRLLIVDRLEGLGEHTIESYFHVHPAVSAERTDEQTVILGRQHSRYRITVSEGDIRIEESWYSPTYGVRHRNKRVTLVLRRLLPASIHVTIQPLAGAEAPG